MVNVLQSILLQASDANRMDSVSEYPGAAFIHFSLKWTLDKDVPFSHSHVAILLILCLDKSPS